MVTPSVHVRTSLESIRPYAHKEQSYILCSKGVERTTGKLLTTSYERGSKEQLDVISLFYLVQTMRKKLDEIYRLHLF